MKLFLSDAGPVERMMPRCWLCWCCCCYCWLLQPTVDYDVTWRKAPPATCQLVKLASWNAQYVNINVTASLVNQTMWKNINTDEASKLVTNLCKIKYVKCFFHCETETDINDENQKDKGLEASVVCTKFNRPIHHRYWLFTDLNILV